MRIMISCIPLPTFNQSINQSIIHSFIQSYRKRGFHITFQTTKHEGTQQTVELANHLLLLLHIGRFLQIEQGVKRILRTEYFGHQEVQ